MNEMTKEQIAWVAGLVEGEGCFYAKRGSKTGMKHLSFSLNMVDKDVMNNLHQIVGLGKLYGPCPAKGKQDYYSWEIDRWTEAYELAKTLWSWLHERRRSKIVEIVLDCHVLPDKTPSTTTWSRTPAKTVIAIRDEYQTGAKQADLARKYSLSPASIHEIVHRKTHQEIC